MTLRIQSIQVGQPVTVPAAGETPEWRSAIFKSPVSGPVGVGPLGLEGDAQADLRAHGGPDKAINVYPAENYAYWQATPALAALTGGAFGENFTTLGLTEDAACVGDIFQVGEVGEVGKVVVQISQPRGPCYKLNRRWQVPDLQQRAEQTRRIGWYFRVLQGGSVAPGMQLALVERPYPQWNIARVWDVTRNGADPAARSELLACALLSADWKRALRA